MNTDLSLVQRTIEQQMAARQFVTAAETVDQNVSRDSADGKMTMARKELMSIVAIAAYNAEDAQAAREIFERFARDLTPTALEVLKHDQELAERLTSADGFTPNDWGDDEKTQDWSPPAELLAKARGS